MEERNVGTIRGRVLNKASPSDDDLTILLPEGRESPYNRLD